MQNQQLIAAEISVPELVVVVVLVVVVNLYSAPRSASNSTKMCPHNSIKITHSPNNVTFGTKR